MQRRQAFGLEKFVLDVFVPTHDTVAVRAGGKKVAKKNIFPGYILVKCSLLTKVGISSEILQMSQDFWSRNRSGTGKG